MNKIFMAIAFGVIVVIVAGQSRAATGDAYLEGRWAIVRMVRDGKKVPRPAGLTITMTFSRADHRWQLAVIAPQGNVSETGTWRLNGSILTTVSETGKIERIRVSVVGNNELEFKKQHERLVLQRR